MLKITGIVATTLLSVMATSVVAQEESQIKLDTSDVRAGGTPVGDLIRIPIERTAITDNVFYVSGLANVYMVNTSEGAIVIDTGFAHQAPKQMALLKEVLTGPVKYIFLPQAQQDDIGGIPLIRDAATYVHDEIWKGLSAGKDVYQLMREIKLPESMSGLSQQHGRVQWTVRETVNQAGAWFPYRHTSELYPYRPHEICPNLVKMAGEENVLKEAGALREAGKLEQALMMTEAAAAANPASKYAMREQVDVLKALLKRAQETHNTFSEVAWLQFQIRTVNKKLGE